MMTGLIIYVCIYYIMIISISMREPSAGLKGGSSAQGFRTCSIYLQSCMQWTSATSVSKNGQSREWRGREAFYRPLQTLLEAHTRDYSRSSFRFWHGKKTNDVIRHTKGGKKIMWACESSKKYRLSQWLYYVVEVFLKEQKYIYIYSFCILWR
jgi:hypothetical protein